MHIRAKFELTMTAIVKRGPNHNSTRTQHVRYATFGREAVQPEDTVVDEFNNYAGRHAIEWQHIDNTSRPFLDGANVSFNFRDMFFSSDSVESDSETCNPAAETILGKLSIH